MRILVVSGLNRVWYTIFQKRKNLSGSLYSSIRVLWEFECCNGYMTVVVMAHCRYFSIATTLTETRERRWRQWTKQAYMPDVCVCVYVCVCEALMRQIDQAMACGLWQYLDMVNSFGDQHLFVHHQLKAKGNHSKYNVHLGKVTTKICSMKSSYLDTLVTGSKFH